MRRFHVAILTSCIPTAYGARPHIKHTVNIEHRWLYSIQTSAANESVRQLEAQMQTWASDIPSRDLLIVGGPHDNDPNPPAKRCSEGPAAEKCKEATALYRAAAQASATGADWYFQLVDEAYIKPSAIKEYFRELDPARPAVYGAIGCGMAWRYHRESGNGTKELPDGWVEPEYSCDTVYQRGGLCMAAGYVLSRAALDLLKRKGQSLEAFVKEYASLTRSQARDLSTTCILYDRGVELQLTPVPLCAAQCVRDSKFSSEVDYPLYQLDFTDKAKIPAFMMEAYSFHQQAVI